MATLTPYDDTWINSQATTTNYSAADHYLTGQHWGIGTPSYTRITLLRIDLTSLYRPPESCHLWMWEQSTANYGTSEPFSWHRCLRNYVASQATWNEWATGQAWSSGPHGLDDVDFEATSYGQLNLTYNTGVWRSFDLTALAKKHYGTVLAIGGMFDTATSASNSANFASTRHATVGNRPYVDVVEPALWSRSDSPMVMG